MGGSSSKPCQTCRDQIKQAGIFAGKINCEHCAKAERDKAARDARPPQRSTHQCGYCKKIKQLDYKAKVVGFYLCEECSGRAQTYLDNDNYSRLEVMAAAIQGNGYTVPPSYLNALEKAKTAVQRTEVKSTSCDSCGMLVEVPYHFEARKVYRCNECAKDLRDFRRQKIEIEKLHIAALKSTNN